MRFPRKGGVSAPERSRNSPFAFWGLSHPMAQVHGPCLGSSHVQMPLN